MKTAFTIAFVILSSPAFAATASAVCDTDSSCEYWEKNKRGLISVSGANAKLMCTYKRKGAPEVVECKRQGTMKGGE